MADGTNLVIQQVGDVSRMQEAMQKTAEAQQHAAAREQLRQEQAQRLQVQKSERSAKPGKVDKDGKKQKNNKENKDNAQEGSGGLLDIVV